MSGKEQELKDLKTKLIDEEYTEPFSVPLETLRDLFEPDNIREGNSLQLVKNWGGYKGMERLLKTSLKNGIEGDFHDKTQRSEKYGTNQAIAKPMKTLMDMVLQNFEDPTLQILCIAAAASLILGIITHGIKEGWLEGVSILLAVVIIVSVTSFNNYMKEQQFRKLNEVAQQKNVNVLRNGTYVNMSVYDLLVGDVVQIQTGQKLSYDGLAFQTELMKTDESALTGEPDLKEKKDLSSLPIKKDEKLEDPFLISGTQVMEGGCMAIVLAVGLNSREGISKLKLQQQSDETPLQEKLEQLANQIGTIGIVSATLTFIALLIHFIKDRLFYGECFICADSLSILVEYFIIAVSIIVIAVPEGLPLAVTISLAYSVGKMKDENNLVRFLQACETMGGANNICTDKTGTLTKNMMAVTKVWLECRISDKVDRKSLKLNTLEQLCVGAIINSSAIPSIDATGKFEQHGNKTDCALLEMAYGLGYDFNKIRKPESKKFTIPFSSSRKKMSTVYENASKKQILYTKGAPDFLLGNCSHYISESGETLEITPSFLRQANSVISTFADESLRTILLCYKYVQPHEYQLPENQATLESNLVIIGIVGIKDPLRSEIPEAVALSKKAGIIVRMVTGDNPQTALAIAKDAGIIPSNFIRPDASDPDAKGAYVVMEGKAFRTEVGGLVNGTGKDEKKEFVKDIKKFAKIARELRVLARSSPEDKYLLATGLKQLGHVVAMTGDGTNDAPALKKADIGFAMGIAGTEVAKDAAGIILLDDNFKSIITAVKYGRNIFDCIRKFLQFQLTVNVVAIFMAFLGAVFIKESPLTPIQMLWVNLIMDTLAALALATEPPENSLLDRMPYGRDESIITAEMWRNIIFHAIFQIFVLCIMLFKGDEIFGVPSQLEPFPEGVEWNDENGQHFTLFFNVFVYLQVFNFLNARKLKKEEVNVFTNMFNNYLFVAIVIGIFIMQIFIVEFGGKALKLVPLSVDQNIVCILIGSLSLVNGVVIKTMLPESCLNSFRAFHIDEQAGRFYDVDRVIKKIVGGKSTNIRKSLHKRQQEKERHSRNQH